MANHIKPTKEELKEQELAAIEAAEGLKDIPVVEEEEEQPEVEEAIEEEVQAEPSKEEKERLKEKLSASARENQKIYAKNRVINKALLDADEMPEPTDEELAARFTDWDIMTDLEKTLAKETAIMQNWRKSISSAKDQATKIEKWNDSIEEFIDDPKTFISYPKLEGKTEEFRDFATKEENNSVPFSLLISAFLYEKSVNTKPNKGQMFETGSGGPNDRPQVNSGKITLEEARKLREVDYPKYKEYLQAGKIEANL